MRTRNAIWLGIAVLYIMFKFVVLPLVLMVAVELESQRHSKELFDEKVSTGMTCQWTNKNHTSFFCEDPQGHQKLVNKFTR